MPLVVGSLGLRECRQNTRLHRTCQIVTFGARPSRTQSHILPRGCLPSGYPAYQPTPVPQHQLEPRDPLQNLTQHLSCPIPFLRELTINLTCTPPPTLDSALFNGDLSSLRTLSLEGSSHIYPGRICRNSPRSSSGYVPETHNLHHKTPQLLPECPSPHGYHACPFNPNLVQCPPRTSGIPTLLEKPHHFCGSSTFHPPQPPLYPSRGITGPELQLSWQQIPTPRLPVNDHQESQKHLASPQSIFAR
jgi:hypothetical protein